MSQWQNIILGDIAFITKLAGYEFTKFFEYIEDGEVIALRGLNLKNGRLDLSEIKRIRNSVSVNLPRSKLSKGDLLLSYTGTLGQIARIDENNKFHLGPNVCLIRPNAEVFGDFLFNYLRSSAFRNSIEASSVGSTQPTIPMKNIRLIEVPLPPISEQKAIASVLSSLDDKIDLLHRQNTILERMAETLFRQWFVEEAQEDWEFVELGEYVNCFNGVSYKSSELNPSKVAMVTLKSFDRNGGFSLDGFKEFTGRFKEQHIVAQGDLVVAHTDITQDAEVIGNPVLVVNDTRYEHMVISMDLVKVKSKYEWLSNEFLYRMMRTREFKEHCLGYSNGSTVLHLSKQAIPSFEFFMPPKEKIQNYTEVAKNLFAKKFKNIEQILTL